MAGYTLLCLTSAFLKVCVHNAVIVRLLLGVCASGGAGLCACGLLLGSSGRKMRKLERERLKEQEQKKAEKEHQAKRAIRLKQEKRRMRSARLGSAACHVKEGHGDDFYIQAYGRFSGTAYKWEYQMPAGTMAGLFDAVPSGGSGMAGTAEAGFTAADVIVSGDTL